MVAVFLRVVAKISIDVDCGHSPVRASVRFFGSNIRSANCFDVFALCRTARSSLWKFSCSLPLYVSGVASHRTLVKVFMSSHTPVAKMTSQCIVSGAGSSRTGY